jgi:Outer membrane lipoprotein-sorting protein
MWRAVLTCMVCLSSAPAFADSSTPTISSNIGDRDKAGLELARRIRNAAPQENTRAQGVLRIRNRERKTVEIPVSFQVLAGGATWQVIYEAKHGSGTTEKLVILRAADRPNEYLYTKPGASEPVKLTGNNAMISFAGSDFWLVDLGLEFLQWPVQRLVKTEMRKSVWCHVLESINPSPRPKGYARVVSWLEKESGGPVLAEAFDSGGQQIKEFSINSIKKIQGEYQLKEMEISSRETGSRTKLEFQLENK